MPMKVKDLKPQTEDPEEVCCPCSYGEADDCSHGIDCKCCPMCTATVVPELGTLGKCIKCGKVHPIHGKGVGM